MELAMLVLGVIIGVVITWLFIRKPETIGTLRVDQSIPDEPPYLFLELKTNVGSFMAKKYVTCEVKVENYLSQD